MPRPLPKLLPAITLLVSLALTADSSRGAAVDKSALLGDGLLTFDATGHFSQALIRADLPKFAAANRAAGAPDENQAVMKGSLSFFGTWSLDDTGSIVTLHLERCSFPNWNGTDQTRRIVLLTSGELRWTNPGASIGGTGELGWKRAM
jgi:Lipocalin-like domain